MLSETKITIFYFLLHSREGNSCFPERCEEAAEVQEICFTLDARYLYSSILGLEEHKS